MKIWTDDEYIEVDPNDVGQLEAAMLFKAEHIKAKADPELFTAVVDMMSRMWDYATNHVDVIRCWECKYRKYDDIFGMIWCNLDSCTKRVKPYDFCSHGERKEGADNEP